MTLEDDMALGGCIAAIVESLKYLGYQHAHYAQLCNECGQLILAASPDGNTHFAISVKTWKPTNDPPKIPKNIFKKKNPEINEEKDNK